MRGFKDIGSKGHFSAKKGGFWAKNPLGGKREFFSKIRLEHFLVPPRCNFVPSFRKKSDARISRYRVTDGRTDGRTDARTNERESIGPSANAERPIKWWL